jgi:hypothetical protein
VGAAFGGGDLEGGVEEEVGVPAGFVEPVVMPATDEDEVTDISCVRAATDGVL